MDTNRKVFRDSSPTSGAKLRSVLGRGCNYFPSSLLRFEVKYIEELKPSHISHRLGETMPSIPGVQLLNEDGIVLSNELVSNFEVKIPPLVFHLFMSLSYQYPSLSPAIGAFDPSGQSLLPYSENILSLVKEARVSYLNTIRGGQKRLKPDIYTYHSASLRQWLFWHILTGEAYIPFACRVSADADCLNITLNRAGETKFEPAYIPDREVFAFQFPSCLLQGEGVISIPAFEARKTRFISILYPAKETLIGFIQPLKHFLKDLRTYLSVFWKGCLKLRELLNLAVTRDRTFVLAIDDDALLKGSVVKSATKSEPVLSLLKYLKVRLKAIFEDLFHLPCTIFNIAHSKKGDKRAFIPALKGEVFSPAIL